MPAKRIAGQYHLVSRSRTLTAMLMLRPAVRSRAFARLERLPLVGRRLRRWRWRVQIEGRLLPAWRRPARWSRRRRGAIPAAIPLFLARAASRVTARRRI